jgi:integrase
LSRASSAVPVLFRISEAVNTGQGHAQGEGANVESDKGVRRGPRGHRKREARSMGRYPFLAFAKEYLERRRAYLAKTSFEEFARKAKYLDRVLVELKKGGRINTTSPAKITEEDIGHLIEWMNEEGHENAYIAKNLGFIKAVCEYAGNGVFTKMKASGKELPKKVPKDLHPLTEEDLNTILQKAEGLHGWNGDVCRFLVWMYPFTGLRASELRLAHLEDIDTVKWTIFVRHPKGEKRYARQRTAPILPPAREAVKRYIEARRNRLSQKGIKSEALIPACHGGFYSSTGFRRMKANLESLVNLDMEEGRELSFNLKMFRTTFCQQCIDRGAKIDSVAVAMGHSSTKTTETFYGRMKTDKALDDLNKAWMNNGPVPAIPAVAERPNGPVISTRLIEQKYGTSGYN